MKPGVKECKWRKKCIRDTVRSGCPKTDDDEYIGHNWGNQSSSIVMVVVVVGIIIIIKFLKVHNSSNADEGTVHTSKITDMIGKSTVHQ